MDQPSVPLEDDPCARRASGSSGPAIASLTPRERDVLHEVARGLTSKEIAPVLAISPKRVDELCESACRKLGVGRRGQAARLLAPDRASPPESFRGEPIRVFDTAPGEPMLNSVHEERAVFTVQPRPSAPIARPGEEKRELAAWQIAGLILIGIIALAIVGIALPPLVDSAQNIGNRITLPHLN